MLTIPRLLTIVIGLALVATVGASGCGQSGSATARVGELAPEIVGTTLDGQTVTLSSLRGHPVIINFWASWCVPCREEFPLLRDELAKHKPDGLEMVGVIFKDQADPARGFATSFGIGWPNVLDPDGKIAAAYRVVAPPQTYFVDRQGVLRSIQIGEILAEDFDRQYAAINR